MADVRFSLSIEPHRPYIRVVMDKTRHITSDLALEILMTENGRKPDPGGIVMPTAPVAGPVSGPVFPTQFRLS